MNTVRLFIDKEASKFLAVIKSSGNNPDVVRYGAVVSEKMIIDLGFDSIEEYVLKSYPTGEITYSEL